MWRNGQTYTAVILKDTQFGYVKSISSEPGAQMTFQQLHYTEEPNEALRFNNRDDAETMAKSVQKLFNTTVTLEAVVFVAVPA